MEMVRRQSLSFMTKKSRLKEERLLVYINKVTVYSRITF